MCMEDIRLGRRLQTRIRDAIYSLGQTLPLVGQDVKRTRLIIQNNGSGTAIIAPVGMVTSTAGGIYIWSNGLPTILRVEDYGPILFNAWNVSTFVANCQLTWIDVTLGDE